MQGLPRSDDPDLLVGPEHFSDAGVYRLGEETAIVQSLDFFPPLVDDPFVYGQIAAANSMGDIYAMGGRMLTALNIVCFPDEALPLEVLQRILAGGAERVAVAGGVVVGGHSVRDAEIKYGLSVTGLVEPGHMMTNRAARPGDALVLTKALGTGFVTTALRSGKCPEDTLQAACASMVALNRVAAEAAVAVGARAATDITGFGLAGHGLEMADASGVSLVLELGRLPILPGAAPLAKARHFTRANATNRAHVAPSLRVEAPGDHEMLEFLVDPQTSGGLLVAVGADRAGELVERCREGGCEAVAVVGSVVARAGAAALILRS